MAGGLISNRKGVNIPYGELKQRVPTEKDIKDLELIAELDTEFCAISFVSTSEDVLHVKKLLENYGNSNIKLISFQSSKCIFCNNLLRFLCLWRFIG